MEIMKNCIEYPESFIEWGMSLHQAGREFTKNVRKARRRLLL